MAKRPSPRESEPSSVKVTVRLPGVAVDVLRHLSEMEERSQSTVMTRALREYCKANGVEWKPYPPE